MSFLDISVYDMTTPEGQQEALDALIDQNNRLYEQVKATQSLSVIGYKLITVNPTNDLSTPNKVYTASYNHGLGFPPLVMALTSYSSSGQYATFPDLGWSYDRVHPEAVLASLYYYVDSQNIYFVEQNVGLNNFGLETALFYIFNVPLGYS